MRPLHPQIHSAQAGLHEALATGPRWKLLLFSLPGVLLALLSLLPIFDQLSSENRWLYRRTYDLVMGEDHLVEWLQVVTLVLIGWCSLRAAWRLYRSQPARLAVVRGRLACLLLLGFAAWVAVGEEISWGQRILGLTTPPALMELNGQKELNIHNIHGLRPYLNGLMIVTSTGLGLCSLVKPALVPRWLGPAFLVTPLYWVSRLATASYEQLFVIRNSEWAEFSLMIGIYLLLKTYTTTFFALEEEMSPGRDDILDTWRISISASSPPNRERR